jgi:hypothetical protein
MIGERVGRTVRFSVSSQAECAQLIHFRATATPRGAGSQRDYIADVLTGFNLAQQPDARSFHRSWDPPERSVAGVREVALVQRLRLYSTFGFRGTARVHGIYAHFPYNIQPHTHGSRPTTHRDDVP